MYKTLKKESLLTIILFILVFFIPFNIKKFLYAFSPHISEYNSVFFYFSDVISILLILMFFVFGGSIYREIRTFFGKIITVFVVLSFVSIFFAPDKLIATYQALRLALYAFSAISISYFIKNKLADFRLIYIAFAASAIFQSIIGFAQFLKGESVGLNFLGESVIGQATRGIARVFISGERFLRSYGTMPHANILAAFLILGLLSLFYLFISEKGTKRIVFWKKVFYGVSIFIVSLGLVTTFSRSGWIVFLITAGLMFIYGIYNKKYRRSTLSLFSIILFQVIFLLSIFGWAIFPRANFTQSEPSIKHRVLYNKIGINIISNYPIGVGIGNEVSFGVKKNLYQNEGFLDWWLWQPIHNLYLLIASELGILGVTVFLVLVYFLFFVQKNRKKFLDNWHLDIFVPLLMLFSILIFGLFDHFMWDIPVGELMMWVLVGFALAFKGYKKETYELY